MIRRLGPVLLAAFSFAPALAPGQDSAVLYQTGFEQVDDPSGTAFQPGDLDGQGSWAVPDPSATIADSDGQAHRGAQYVSQLAASTVDLSLEDDADAIFIEAWHRGAGVETLEKPPASPSAAAVIGFRLTSPGFYTVAALDGTEAGNEGASFVESPSIPEFSSTAWTRFLIRVDYANRTWDVQAAGETIGSGFGFRDADALRLRGFRSSTDVGADLDTFRIVETDGDYDDDGFSDAYEMANDSDPLDPATIPGLGDVNGDGYVNVVDAILNKRIASGFIGDPASLGYTPADVDLDGFVTEADGDAIYRFSVGDPAVPVLPVAP
ncbi:MAG: dockerin type I repeat-containing protein [Sumerlaeia bacterium]